MFKFRFSSEGVFIAAVQYRTEDIAIVKMNETADYYQPVVSMNATFFADTPITVNHVNIRRYHGTKERKKEW